MPSHHGSFYWYELLTTDMPAAEAFYSAVLGWTATTADHASIPYRLFHAGTDRVAGLMTLPDGAAKAGMPPAWLGSIAVDDLDASLAKLQAAGGELDFGHKDIPVGRFATVRDPQGATFILFQPGTDVPPAPALPTQQGYAAWRELYTTDPAAGFQFYAALFGWTKGATHDMGDMGAYQLFAHNNEEIGGIMQRPPFLPVSAWGYYFSVDAIAPAIDRIKTAGGTVTNGPHQVPGGQWIVQGMDPQGGAFALVSAVS